MFVLDTNVVSELRKVGDGRADARVTAWISRHDAASFYISALTLMELEIGILRVERRDAEQGEWLGTWTDRHVVPEFAERALPVDSAVALKCARLHVPEPRAERDALIAATAMVHGMTVVSGNRADFAATGAVLVDPWAEACAAAPRGRASNGAGDRPGETEAAADLRVPRAVAVPLTADSSPA